MCRVTRGSPFSLTTMTRITRICALTLTLLATLPQSVVVSATYNTDSLMHVLECVIDSGGARTNELQAKVARHRDQLAKATDAHERIVAVQQLYHDFYRLQFDSALVYARMRVDLAREIGNPDTIAQAQITVAEALKCLGFYDQALAVLHSIEHTPQLLQNSSYYYQCHSTLLSLSEITADKQKRQLYQERLKLYRDTIAHISRIDGISLSINNSEILKGQGKCAEALEILESYMRLHPHEQDRNPIFWFTLADTYEKLQRTDEAKACYTMAAIIDLRRNSKTYTSLQHLAMLLYEEGDMDRAFRFITLSMNDVVSSGARQRLDLAAGYLPIITSAHEQQHREIEQKRNIIIVFVSLSAIALAILLFLLYRDNKRLATMRAKLEATNKELNLLNDELKSLNGNLIESNKVKEVYIAQLFNLCANDINRMEQMRLSVLNKIKIGMYRDVEKQLSQSTSSPSLKEFFQNFDKIFLQLFPDFVHKFNSLLLPDQQINVKHDDLLTPELRIFALVRLGFNDSTKIAHFLHYSPQTVYNYRQKIRNKARISKDEFNARVMTL